MNERQRSPLPLNLTPRAIGLVKETGSRIKETARRLLPRFPKTLPVVQRANRALRDKLQPSQSYGEVVH